MITQELNILEDAQNQQAALDLCNLELGRLHAEAKWQENNNESQRQMTVGQNSVRFSS